MFHDIPINNVNWFQGGTWKSTGNSKWLDSDETTGKNENIWERFYIERLPETEASEADAFSMWISGATETHLGLYGDTPKQQLVRGKQQ